MNHYRLDFLNDKEFEVLACDILSTLLSIHVESFKPGRDRGVDGRYFDSDESENIVQCKHWEKSGIRSLLKHLENEEVTKVRLLKPARYYLFTSVPLSRNDKSKIRAFFRPYIQRDDDIYGNEDIQSLLSLNPKLVEGHYKLWFAGSEVLRQIHSAAIKGRSRFTAEEMQSELPRYVFTSAYLPAIKKLEAQKSIVITGAPGIGKTTLAKQLLWSYLSRGYELVHITGDLSEAEDVFSHEEKQIFYFDDFLGRNYLLFFEGDRDSRVMDFIVRISRAKDKRFILTSRTGVLNRAKSISESIQHANLPRKEFEINVDEIKPLERAQILYNHLWHSGLSNEHLTEVFRDKRYRYIINHSNYNPRIIQFFTDADKTRDIKPSDYWAYVSSKLANPDDVWRGVYENQIDAETRWILCAVVFNGGTMRETDLRHGFYHAFKKNYLSNPIELDEHFENAMRVGCGSVVVRNILIQENEVLIGLFNPSVGDFVIRRYSADATLLAELLLNLGTVGCLTNLRLLKKNNIIESLVYNRIIDSLIRACNEDKVSKEFRLKLCGLIADDELIPSTYKDWMRLQTRHIDDLVDVCANNSRHASEVIEFAIYCCRGEFFNDDNESDFLRKVVEALLDLNLSLEQLRSLSVLLDIMGEIDNDDLYRAFRKRVIAKLSGDIDYMIEDHEVISEVYDYYAEEREARNAVLEYVDSELKDFYIEFDDSDAEEIAEKCEIQEIVERNCEARTDAATYQPTGARNQVKSQNDEIDELFDHWRRPTAVS